MAFRQQSYPTTPLRGELGLLMSSSSPTPKPSNVTTQHISEHHNGRRVYLLQDHQGYLDLSPELHSPLISHAGDIPSMKIFESEKTLAFLDIGPLSKGHSVSPLRQLPSNRPKKIRLLI